MSSEKKEQNIQTNKKEPPINNWKQKLNIFFHSLFSMKGDIDKDSTVVSIKKNMKIYGANAWMLILSILIASLGLDLDSPAVIIGAMLVSPLMSPILGIGLAVGINDKDTLITSLQHFGIAIAIALTVSTLYFIITPLGELTNSIVSRTKPTFLDGLVAIAGGFAGIISSVQKDKSNAIPGVAIATALMPPLCVSGYGLATFNYVIFFNSFYLFFLNSFFIAISTFVVVQYLNFPHKKFIDKKDKIRTSKIIALISILIIIPSAYILLTVILDTRRETDIKDFIADYLDTDQRNIVKHNLISQKDTSILIVNILGNPIENTEKKQLDSILNSYSSFLKNPIIIAPIQAQVGEEDFLSVQNKLSTLEGNFNKKLAEAIHLQTKKDANITKLSKELDSIRVNDIGTLPTIYTEISIVFENIEDIAFGNIQFPVDTFKNTFQVAYVQWKKKISKKTKNKDKEKLAQFLKLNMKKDTVIILDQ